MSIAGDSGLVLPLIPQCTCLSSISAFSPMTPRRWVWPRMRGRDLPRRSPIRTGIQGFTYDIRTAVLPFMFIFNTQLLMIGIDHWWELLLTIVSAVSPSCCSPQRRRGYFLVRSRIWETLLLLLVSLYPVARDAG